MRYVLSRLVLLNLLFIFVSAAMSQAEMYFTGGWIPIPTVAQKLSLIALLGLSALLGYSVFAHSATGNAAKWLSAYLAVDFVWLLAVQEVKLENVLITLNSVYLVLLITTLADFSRLKIPGRTALRTFGAIFVTAGALGLVQFLASSPVLPTESRDGAFIIYSWEFGDNAVRAFSLFNTALEFGILPCVVGAIGIAVSRLSHRRVAGMLLFAAATVVVYSTLTRTVYIQFVFVCLAAFVLTSNKLKGIAKWLPALFLVLTPIVIVRALNVAEYSNLGILSGDSIILRLGSWSYYLEQLALSSPAKLLLGQGIAQHDRLIDGNPLIDNTYLAIVLGNGVLGLVMVSVLFIRMWTKICNDVLERPTVFAVGIASVFATFAQTWFFNVEIQVYGVLFALFLLTADSEVGEKSKILAVRQLKPVTA